MKMTTIDELASILKKKEFSYSIIEYPEKKKSVDIIAKNDKNIEGKTLVLKVSDKKHNKILNDLKKLAEVSNALPIVVNDEVEEEVVSERDNVLVMNKYTLEKMIEGEKLFLMRTRGGIFVKINSKVLKQKRQEKGMSLGTLAEKLGVSRISIYDYEKEDSYVSLEVAERLVELFGEEVIGNILDDFKISSSESQDSVNKIDDEYGKLIKNLADKGFKVVRFEFTAVDLAAIKSDKKLFFCIDADFPSTSLKKFNEAKKLVSKINAKLYIITRNQRNHKIYEKENFNVYELGQLNEIIDEID
jgi:putative transcriptional regulator